MGPVHLHLSRCVIDKCDTDCPREGRPTRADGRCGCGCIDRDKPGPLVVESLPAFVGDEVFAAVDRNTARSELASALTRLALAAGVELDLNDPDPVGTVEIAIQAAVAQRSTGGQP